MSRRSGNTVIGSPSRESRGQEEIVATVVLNKGSDDQLECQGYCRSVGGVFLYYLITFLTLGASLLLFHWKPYWKVKVTKQRSSLSIADTVVLKDNYGQMLVEEVHIDEVDTAGPVYSSDSEVCFQKHGSLSPSMLLSQHPLCDAAHLSDGTSLLSTTVSMKQSCYIRYFEHQHIKYVWDTEVRAFIKLRGLDVGVQCSDFYECFTGLLPAEQARRLEVYGLNKIFIPVKSYGKLFIEEVLNPFYIFQICSVILWMCDQYYIYSCCIVAISALSMAVSLYETRKQSETLRDMVMTAASTITVCRGDGIYEEVTTDRLVPGDVVIIPSRCFIMDCDAVLVAGNVIVNESMLTGESVPVTKTPLTASGPEEVYSPNLHKRHTIYSGTQVIQTRFYGDSKVTAIVVRTGFSTAKGELVCSILHPRPLGFQFYRDAMKFIGVLACIATVGMCYSIVTLVIHGAHPGKIVLRALDIITIVVPPALPAAMTVGMVYAQNRLKKQGIFCISPPRINMCGKLKCICFDKTGTLTEEGLDLWGVVPVQENQFLAPVHNIGELLQRSHMMVGMATCHSLTIIGGEMTGDPLDLKMFNSTKWTLDEPGQDTTKFDSIVPTVVKPATRETYYLGPKQLEYEVGIMRQFTFTSSLQRMSVITRTLGAENMEVYCKGAPEKIASLCKPESLPADFSEVLHRYTMSGLRVIGLAHKQLDSKVSWHQVQRIPRDQAESDLEFVGLLVMENAIKPQTKPVISQLLDADIRTIMVTGDNILTAVSVARHCGMVGQRELIIMVNAHPPQNDKPAWIEWEAEEKLDCDDIRELQEHVVNMGNRYHFAVTGGSFAVLHQYFKDLMPKICVRGTVFARMGPDQKSLLVEYLQGLGYCVGMCGDGANDCGALKTAHVGISLSEAEASVASPFTSKHQNISCVPTVIREGRAALVTSFGVFKYMALYSMVQFVSVLILYSIETNLGDWMFLYVDLVITTTVAVLMGHTGAYRYLVRKRPMGSLISPVNLISIISNVLIVIAFQTGMFFYLRSQPWFEPVQPSPSAESRSSYESTTIFLVSSFQYIILAFCFSRGRPYRKPVWTNVPFLLSVLGLTGLTVLLLLHPFSFFENIFQMHRFPSFMFRVTLLLFLGCNFMLVLLLESFIIPSRGLAGIVRLLRRKKMSKNRYKSVEADLKQQTDWPPVGGTTTADGSHDTHIYT